LSANLTTGQQVGWSVGRLSFRAVGRRVGRWGLTIPHQKPIKQNLPILYMNYFTS